MVILRVKWPAFEPDLYRLAEEFPLFPACLCLAVIWGKFLNKQQLLLALQVLGGKNIVAENHLNGHTNK
jgi:hypothetical protein